MKKIIAILFLLAFVAQTFSKSLIVAEYYTNTSSFAANCENKARPKLHCNGKCQMMKRMKEQEKKESQEAAKKGSPQVDVLSSKSFAPQLQAIIQQSVITYPSLPGDHITAFARSIFRPPCC